LQSSPLVLSSGLVYHRTVRVLLQELSDEFESGEKAFPDDIPTESDEKKDRKECDNHGCGSEED